MRYFTKSNFANAQYATAKRSASMKKIKGKSRTKYYVQVRTYKVVDGVKYYSSWSKTKSVKVK